MPMKQMFFLIATAIALSLPSGAWADCYVAYKAKRDNPLRLHYGVLSLSGSCGSASSTKSATQARLNAAGWTLLNVISASQNTPSQTMKANAGEHFLRY